MYEKAELECVIFLKIETWSDVYLPDRTGVLPLKEKNNKKTSCVNVLNEILGYF